MLNRKKGASALLLVPVIADKKTPENFDKENVMAKINPFAPPSPPIKKSSDDDGPQGELPEVEIKSLPIARPIEDPDDAISLAEESDESSKNTVKIMGTRKILASKETFTRTPTLTGAGAVRCRVWYSRIAVAPLQYMEQQINEWLDANQIEVKSVTQVVGVMEGKSPEPNVIVTVWY